MFFIPIRWEQSLNTCVYLMCLACVNMFVQFARLTSKMIGQKSQQQKEEGCGKTTIGKTPLVKVLRRIFYAVMLHVWCLLTSPFLIRIFQNCID